MGSVDKLLHGHQRPLGLAVILDGKMRTTTGAQRRWPQANFTDYTDLEYVMSPCPFTHGVNALTAIYNSNISVKSVKT